jgi:hypothetical protein
MLHEPRTTPHARTLDISGSESSFIVRTANNFVVSITYFDDVISI